MKRQAQATKAWQADRAPTARPHLRRFQTREHMAEFAEMKVLELWYSAVEVEMLIAGVKDAGIRHGAP